MAQDDFGIEKRFIEMHERANRIFEEMWEMSRPVLMMPDHVWKPALDIYETEDEVIVLVEIAGMKKEEIEVAMQGNILIVSGNRVEDVPYKKKLEQMEINYGRFQRIVKIFTPIEREKITATYEKGLLKIHLPKKDEIQQLIRVTPHKQGSQR
jgi:HSP20 family protein